MLDVTFGEDDCRSRRDRALRNFNTLRRSPLNLLKHGLQGTSLKRRRVKAALDHAYRAKVIFGYSWRRFDEEGA
jgi:hypothetical protein